MADSQLKFERCVYVFRTHSVFVLNDEYELIRKETVIQVKADYRHSTFLVAARKPSSMFTVWGSNPRLRYLGHHGRVAQFAVQVSRSCNWTVGKKFIDFSVKRRTTFMKFFSRTCNRRPSCDLVSSLKRIK